MRSSQAKQTKPGRNIGLIAGGLLITIIGIVCLVFPKATLTLVAILLGAVFLLLAYLDLRDYSKGRGTSAPNTWALVTGIVKGLIGLIFVFYPLFLSNLLPWLIAIVVGISGIWQLGSFLQLRRNGIDIWWIGAFAAALIVVIAVFMLLQPKWLSWLLGIYAIIRGMSMVVNGLFSTEISYENRREERLDRSAARQGRADRKKSASGEGAQPRRNANASQPTVRKRAPEAIADYSEADYENRGYDEEPAETLYIDPIDASSERNDDPWRKDPWDGEEI